MPKTSFTESFDLDLSVQDRGQGIGSYGSCEMNQGSNRSHVGEGGDEVMVKAFAKG